MGLVIPAIEPVVLQTPPLDHAALVRDEASSLPRVQVPASGPLDHLVVLILIIILTDSSVFFIIVHNSIT